MNPTVERLTSKCCTRNPFEVAQCCGYIVLRVPLKGIRGFCQRIKRQHIIYMDDQLDEATARFVCAHEIAHIRLHGNYNRIFMDSRTFFLTNRYEKEADCFAVDLLWSDEDLQEYARYTIPQVAQILGVTEELAEYRMSSVQPRLIKKIRPRRQPEADHYSL